MCSEGPDNSQGFSQLIFLTQMINVIHIDLSFFVCSHIFLDWIIVPFDGERRCIFMIFFFKKHNLGISPTIILYFQRSICVDCKISTGFLKAIDFITSNFIYVILHSEK